MDDLSPAAQAVLNAMRRSYDHEPIRRAIAAEILRTVANHPMPPLFEVYTGSSYDEGMADGYDEMRRRLRVIASELEGHHG